MPAEERVKRAIQLARRRGANFDYLFDRLTDPDWIDALAREGMFADPPPLEVEGGYIQFRPWAASRFLARMSPVAADEVVRVLRTIPATDNPLVHQDYIDAALAMDVDTARELVRREQQWLSAQTELFHSLPEKVGQLVKHLAESGEVREASRLARTLLSVREPTTSEERVLASEPHGKFNDWEYGEILRRYMPSLVAASPTDGIHVLAATLNEAIEAATTNREETDDYSYVWRPAIEEHEQNQDRGIRNALITTLRDALVDLIRNGRLPIDEGLDLIQHWDWPVFHRLTLYVLAVSDEAPVESVRMQLMDREAFDSVEVRHEYALLAARKFDRLSESDLALMWGWIQEGPDTEHYVRLRGEEEGRAPSKEEVEKYKRRWQHQQLGVLGPLIPDDWTARREELTKEFGKVQRPDFPFYSESWVGPTSPASAEDLRKWSPEETIRFLGGWRPSNDQWSPSPEGLGRVLAQVVAENPVSFAASAETFKTLMPTYVRALVQGLREAAKQGTGFDWEPALRLASWVVQQPDETRPESSGRLDTDPGWSWTRKAIADLLQVAFEPRAAELTPEHRQLAWSVLKPLTRDTDPSPDSEEKAQMDPPTRSINSVRGEALHAVVGYALWLHRQQGPVTTDKPRPSFSQMPEVRETLEERLQTQIDSSAAVRSVYGWRFPQLMLLDKEWASQQADRIFSHDRLGDAAWRALIIFNRPYSDIFELLKHRYSKTVERLSEEGGEPEGSLQERFADRFAEHIASLYIGGVVELSDPVLVLFFTKAPANARGRAVHYAGVVLRDNEELDQAVIKRIERLWESRISAAQSASGQGFAEELAAFGWWFTSDKLDSLWALEQLHSALRLHPKTELDDLVVERLGNQTASGPLLAIRCLRLLVDGDREGWNTYGWRHSIRTVLDQVVASEDYDATREAVDLAHILGSRGFEEFRDVADRQ